jgi:two-component system, cell cycle response regulator CtrA
MTVHVMTVDRAAWHMVEDACGHAGMEVVNHDHHQKMASALYREPGSIGVYSASPGVAHQVCEAWRQANIDNLLIVLTRNARTFHRAAAMLLNSGADDVQSDTIYAEELAARLMAISGRVRHEDTPMLRFCGCAFNKITGDVYSPFGYVNLTKREADFLTLLIMREGFCVTREMFFTYAYQGRDEPHPKIIDVYACKVRKKLAHLTGGLDVIETIWGRGFRFVREGVLPEVTEARRVG